MRRIVSLVFALLLCALSVIAGPTKKPPAKPVNLNTASAQQLETVPGIGPATAAKIIQMRKSYGAFKSVDDLRAVRGIGPKRIEKMRKYLTVGKPAAVKPSAPDAKCPACEKRKTPRVDAGSPANPAQPRL